MSIWTDKDGNQHVSLMVGGKRIHRRIPQGASARAVKQLEAELRTALGRKLPNIPGDPPMAEVMGHYLAHCKTLRSPDTAKFHALRLGPWVQGRRASEARLVASEAIKGMHAHYKPATINRSLSAMQKALKMAWESGSTPENYGLHVKRIPENNARDVHLSIKQVHKLADCASDKVRAAIWIALYTGCRRGEILAIQPADIGKTEITIRAGNTKTLKTRVVPIIPALRPWLKHLPIGLTFEGLKTGFRRAREAAGMPEVHYHDLRHSCASILLASGADLYTVSNILGHSTIKMTERYTHLQVGAKRRALEKAFR